MPSFLSKVFGRKKGDEKESTIPRSIKRTSDPSLLEGKFEAIPSTISPSTPKFPEDVHASGKGKDKEGEKSGPFGLLRSKPKPRPSSPTTNAPHLTLRLPDTIDKDGDSLVASFNPQADETEDSVLTRRLTPAETLLLIEACSKAITERGGLETLGVMRPHWHSTSPQLQRKLISLFILSLAQKSPETTLAPSTSPSAAFSSELEYTRSVHDIAAVLRWALRHLRLEGASFGSSPSSNEWSWYNSFYEAERKSNYDPRTFTTKLVPEISSTHTTLLIPILDIISSLAAHAEANGYSGSKLTKYFGFWLLTARRGAGTEDWKSFYMRWEVSGRMLEHLFLSWLRDENTKRPLPRRLQELVAQYPYTTSPDPTVDGLLTRPRFSTRRHDALFVRVEVVYADHVEVHSSRSPIGIFADALKSEPKSDSGGHFYLWDQLKAVATSDSGDKPLPAILSDDTIGLLSLVSTDPKEQALLGISGAASTVVTPLSPVTETLLSPTANGNGVSIPVRKPTLPSSTPQSPKDWAEFSSAGFGEITLTQNFASTLLDKDVEVTEPPTQKKPSKRRQDRNTMTSVDFSSSSSNLKAAPEEPEGPKLVLAATEVVQLDEAFIDFWRDTVADPISSDWPKFVIGELKHPLTLRSTPTSSRDEERESSGSPINWIIIEEKFRRPTPPLTHAISHDALLTSGGLKVAATPLKRTSSPRPSFGEKKSSSLSATFKRFTLFGGSKDDLTTDNVSPTAGGSSKKDSFSGKKKSGVGRSQKIGEMGEALSEEPEPQPEVPKKGDEPERVEKAKSEESGKGKSEVVAVATGVVGGAVPTSAVGSVQERVDAVDIPPKEGKDEVPVAFNPAILLVSTTDAPAVGEPERAQKALPEVPPVVEEPSQRPASADTTEEPIVDVTPTAPELESEPAVIELTPEPVVEESEPPATTNKAEELTAEEDVTAAEVPSSQMPAPVSEQESEPEATTIHPIVGNEDVAPAPPVEEPQPVITETASPLPPDVSAPEQPEEIMSIQPASSEPEPTSVPVVECS